MAGAKHRSRQPIAEKPGLSNKSRFWNGNLILGVAFFG